MFSASDPLAAGRANPGGEGTDLLSNATAGPKPMQTEGELVSRCRDGQRDAWDALFDKYYATVARFVFQLSGDFSHEDTEEICQETFLAVVRSVDSFKARSSFQTWLLRIAANKAMDFREKAHAAKRGGNSVHLSLDGSQQEDASPMELPSSRPSPDALLLQGEDFHLIRQALDRLGEPCREVIELRVLRGSQL